MKTFTIEKLFDIEYGQKEYHNKEWLEGNEGKNILISSKGIDNGVYGFFNIENKFKAPIITVQGYGTIGHAFVQEYDCSVDDHMLILKPKKKMNVYQLYQIAFQIRLVKWKYKYGRGITPSRLKDQKIILYDLKKDWKKLEKNNTPKNIRRKTISQNYNIKWKKVKDICKIDRKYSLYLNEINEDEKQTPYVTTTEKNNGVKLFCGEDPVFKSSQVTVALDGRCGETFYQIMDFISGEKTATINHSNKCFLIYVGACIRLLSWKFHYGRKLSKVRLENMKIPVPYKNNDIDFEYIENLAKNCYGYEELKPFL